MSPGEAWALARDAGRAWSEDRVSSMGAALSYYTLFSLAPLVLVVISIAGLAFGASAARGEVLDQLERLLGSEGASTVAAILDGASQPAESLLAAAAGMAALLLGATGAFNELQSDLDRIWRLQPSARRGGVAGFFRPKLLSFAMVLGIAGLVVASLAASTALAVLGDRIAHAADLGLSFVVMTAAFAMLYKILPSVRLAWRDVWFGAAVTAVLFSAGKVLIGLYLGRSGVASAFGAAGSVVLLLVWVYYSAQVLLLGAEITRLHAARSSHGSWAGHEVD
jgi:membrane protein